MILRQAALCCLMIASAPERERKSCIGDEGWEEQFRKSNLKSTEPINVNYLRAFCALQAPRRLPSSSPSSERGTAGPARCLAVPTTHPDHRPPYRSRSGCCLCPPGTSAVEEGGILPPTDCCGEPSPPQPSRTHTRIFLPTSFSSVVVLIIRTLFCEPHHSFPPTGTILVTGLLAVPRTNVWEDWGSQKLPIDFFFFFQ